MKVPTLDLLPSQRHTVVQLYDGTTKIPTFSLSFIQSEALLPTAELHCDWLKKKEKMEYLSYDCTPVRKQMSLWLIGAWALKTLSFTTE